MTAKLEQIVTDGYDKDHRCLRLPHPKCEILPGIPWGRAEVLFTPAFWAATMWLERKRFSGRKDLGVYGDLKHEILGCLLGGYGITFESNRAALAALLASGLLDSSKTCESQLAKVLSQPLELANGKRARYRFPNQKARFLAAALKIFETDTPPQKPLALRDWLCSFPGIGFKTASWIVRNHTGSDAIAIIDIHIQRAGLIMGIFRANQCPAQDYLEMEMRFLELAHRMSAKASDLDLVIWEKMRQAGKLGIQAVKRSMEKFLVIAGAQ